MKATVDALIALADGRRDAAAHTLLRSMPANGAKGPINAAANNNVGIAALIAGTPHLAASRLETATQLWADSRAYIERTDVPLAGRGSVFHLRLAMQHQDAFTQLKRQPLFDLCAAGSAISNCNWDLARARPEPAATHQDLIARLTATLGPGCAEIRLLEYWAAPDCEAVRAAYRAKADALAQSADSFNVDSHDARSELKCAVQMTVLLHPSLLRPTTARA
ncbi:hypothetical protein [Hyphomicrobium sp. 1Nfss2.1]|uniref:hypothetical protein n=1 Tax=Hyphomicrobium sp. 1Nfss2.1 TaxID=3413936 RepID=UPI003C7EBB47